MKFNKLFLRRALLCALAFTLVITSFCFNAISASAAENELDNNGWFNVLDYGTLVDQNGNPTNNTFFPLNGYQPFGVMLPTEQTLYAVDMIISIDGSVNLQQLEVQFGWDADTTIYSRLEIYHIGGNLYRVHGDVPKGNYHSFNLRFWNYDGQIYYINVLSLNVSIAEITFFMDIGSVSFQSNGGSSSGSMPDVNTNKALVHYWSETSNYVGTVWFNTWRRYDFVDFYVSLDVDSINSISAADTYNNIVPFTVNYLSDGSGGRYFLRIRLDLRGMDKTMDVTNVYYPFIHITGQGTGNFSINLRSVVGHVVIPAPSVETHWWTKLLNSIGSLFSQLGQWLTSGFDSVVDAIEGFVTGSAEQKEQIDQAVDNMEQSSGVIGDLGDQMNSVPKPSPDDLNVSPDAMVPDSALLAYTAPITFLWENDTLVAMLTIVVTLVLVSWVFFGKKG